MKGRGMALGMLVALVAGAAAGALLAQQRGQPVVRPPENQVIENTISEMLAAWQLGDVALLRKYYAEEMTVVSGNYEPPILGWNNYLAAYQQQRQRLQQVRLDRRNTYQMQKGNIAWASYQWEFAALVEGQPSGWQGHTTLILERRGDRWVILHNHTSLVVPVPARPPEPTPPAPAKPGE